MPRSYDFDIVVIGAGIAGLVSAVTANGLGKKIAIIERDKIGGNCTNLTCIPSKALIRLGHYGKDLRMLGDRGFFEGERPILNKSAFMPHIRNIVQKAYEKDVPESFSEIGIEVVPGEASFVDSHTIRVKEKLISSEKFIIACGTIPIVPNIPGLRDTDYLTNENIYKLDKLPDSVVILGGGVDGFEYGSALGRLGVHTRILERSFRVFPNSDRELVNCLLGIFKNDGIQVIQGTRAVSFANSSQGAVIEIEDKNGIQSKIEAERILLTIGRQPDFGVLGLDRAGVRVNAKGIITDRTLRTTCPTIYACGDIVGPDLLATTAEYQGIIAGTNASLPVKSKVDYKNNVYVTFTDPPLAQIGLTEEQALRKYSHKLQVFRFDYSNMRRALIDGTAHGMAKFLCDGKGRLVGAHILGEAAPEVIHEAQLIKALKKPIHKLNLITHAYPTYSQALVGRASQLAFLDKMQTNFFVDSFLRFYPGLSNKLSSARNRLAEYPTDHVPETSLSKVNETTTNLWKIDWLDTETLSIELPTLLMDYNELPLLGQLSNQNLISAKRVILDFSELDQMNGLGAAFILKLYTFLHLQNKDVVCSGLNSDLRIIFQSTELNQILEETAPTHSSPDPKRLQSHVTNLNSWSKYYPLLTIPKMPKEARNLNVSGRRTSGPVNGFGQLIQKVYRLTIRDPEITPEDALFALKTNFPEFQPHYNTFYPTAAGIAPGEVVLINSSTPGGPIATGVMVLYADELSFTFNTPIGHPESGWVSFLAKRHNGVTIVEIVGIARANDPIYELAFHLVGSKVQVRIWNHVLTALSAYFGTRPDIQYEERYIDHKLQWSQWKNIIYNAQVRTLLAEPLRWFRTG
jgi:pyruvate/2-oxoglutarate dehydrogenase complex dihydrolipoamide dehydrogenase (E3) component/anti-anti-sigma regulatory factor